MVKFSRCNPDSVPAWRQLTRTALQALTLWDKALNNVGSYTGDETAKVLWQLLWNWEQRWADKQRTMRRTQNRINVPLSLKCACCLLFSPASPTHTCLQPQRYLQAIRLTGGQIIMQSTGSFTPGAGEAACTTTFGCYCSYFLFFFVCFFFTGLA